MHSEANHQKINTRHLQRDAYVYIRQSSMGQVLNNKESAILQYDFRRQAVALGWQEEQIRVIDCDQGETAAVKDARDGFEQLVADVSMARAGVVVSLEVSRLARNSADWHRLLELCAFTDTLVMDQDGLYDLGNFNDRLLLGLKGVMSEAELHVLRSRMLQGLRNKAKRGELIWAQLTHSLALSTLHNPRYAGAFCFGRNSCRTGIGGRKHYRKLPMDQWQVLIKDKHAGYISWEQYEENIRRLNRNADAYSQDRRRSPPREGRLCSRAWPSAASAETA